MSSLDRRRAPRHRTRFDTLCSGGHVEGAGVLDEISYSGARVCDASHRPDLGAKVTLYVFLQPVAPVELSGYVVRHTDTGFAMSLDPFDAELRRLVDDVSGIL